MTGSRGEFMEMENEARVWALEHESEERADTPTRERCHRCGRRGWGFYSPLWEQVAGRFKDSIMCAPCFGELGDEKNIDWTEGLEIHLVSIREHHKFIESVVEWDGSVREWKEGRE